LGALQAGRVLGNRYEILQLLGEGGMGAVYKARDREVDRLVAVKVIRPELASRADILARFKQELILARQVTHKNVIRIFDLGESDGLKFITMDFIEGRDLKSILREKGRFSPDEAVKIATQICRALDAAHSEGVVHRDLKPQNIMLGQHGRVTVMDFGIARSMDMPGMTQTGSLVGTPEYMSPEQAKGEDVDARSDLFTLGIIFYELLTGKTPFYADTAYATLLKRTQERARDPVELDPSIPAYIGGVVMKCLETNRDQRYSSALDIVHDLGQQTVTSGTAVPSVAPAAAVPVPATPRVSAFQRYRLWIAASAVLLAIVAGLVYGLDHGLRRAANTAATNPSVSLAILPFSNATGDQKLDWLGPSLANMLATGVGQSSHLRVIPPDRLNQILLDLQLSPDSFQDAANVRRLGEMSKADTIVWGRYRKVNGQIHVEATLRDIKRDRNVSFSADATNENIPPVVDALAQKIRENLSFQGNARNILAELKAQSFKPSTKSPDALRLYSAGKGLELQGKNLEALSQFQAATQADPQFALAYARLGQTYANLGHDAEADAASRKAVSLAENLPTREKYLITANNASIEHDYPKAIEYYENLAQSAPGDPEFQYQLGLLYESTGDLDRAGEHYSKVLASEPQNVSAVLASGRLGLRGGNIQGALDTFSKALILADKQQNDEAKATILQGIGVCYRALDKRADALRYFQQALQIRERLDDKRGIAVTLNVIGQVEDQSGKSSEALAAYQRALKIRRDIGDKAGLGDTLVALGGFYQDRGRYDDALPLFKEALQVQRDLGSESNQGLCLNDIGLTYLSKGDYENALTYFQQALDLRQKSQVPDDIAFALHNLAVTSEKMGQYDTALTYYERALDLYRKAGEKDSAAMDSYGRGVLFGYQGRFGAAINAKQEALAAFTELHDRTYWMTEVESGYGKALADAGRFEDARKPLDDALALARQLKIDGSIAQALDFQGELLFYRGDFKGARSLYDQAMQFASRSKEQEKILRSRYHIAEVMLKQGQASKASRDLRTVAGKADALSMKYLSLEASAMLGEALVESRDYTSARQQLERTVAGAQKLELRPILVQAHYSLGNDLRLTGHGGQAADQYRQALQYLDQIRKDAGSDAFLQRSDLKSIYGESVRWSKN
jgi:eukaryotic-like serine/threonine-protein kinase